ncbi:MAG: hypothetical protein Q8K07_12425 [Methylicorpusculum sp.]|uniref:hypothetical protein n=2 Tax=Methylicorpusculum sp. TaxID=2713644 RepID=UPI0027304101|nr:hypothetical protein [Methylicorpusculum sp.]MDP2202820.1 hypothetical protein [Methylicorpusculum sp.]
MADFASNGETRRSGRDCRNPEAMDGIELSHPCALDTGTNLSGTDLHLPEGRQAGQPDVNPCRDDGLILRLSRVE